MSRTMLKGLLRKALGVSVNDDIIAPSGFSTGGDGRPTITVPSWNRMSFFDDFEGIYFGDTGSGGPYYYVHGADSGADGSIQLLSGGTSAVRLTAPANFVVSNGGGAPDMAGLVLGRHFATTQGQVRFAARVRNVDTGTTANGVSMFCGFTDDTGTTEVAFYVDTGEDNSADTGSLLADRGEIAAKAANGVGWLFDTAVDTGSGLLEPRWCGVAVNASSVKEPVIASRGLVPNNWDTVEVVLDNDVAHFWLYDKNGVGSKVGTILSPVAKTVKLSPVISITGHHISDTGAGDTGTTVVARTNRMDVDFLHVSANRDTGT